MTIEALVRTPGNHQGVSLAGHPMAFLLTGTHTKYTSMFDWTMPPRFSTGRHVHRVQEETFFVLEGECEWLIGSELVRATPGTFAFVPPGVPHDIVNARDEPSRVLMTVSPPGHERYFAELARLAGLGPAPDPQAVGALRDRYDTDQLTALRTER